MYHHFETIVSFFHRSSVFQTFSLLDFVLGVPQLLKTNIVLDGEKRKANGKGIKHCAVENSGLGNDILVSSRFF